MDKKDEMFCWTYNVVDKDKYKAVLESVPVDPVVDFGSDEGITKATGLVVKRIDGLKDAGSFSMDVADDAISFNLLQMAASVSKRGKKWYVEKEGKLFDARIKKIGNQSISWFMNEVFNSKVVVLPASGTDFKYYKDESTPGKVKVRWECFPDLISERKLTLIGGWIYATNDDVIAEMSKIYKAVLSSNLIQIGHHVEGSDIEDVMKEYAVLLDSMVASFNIPANSPASYVIEHSPSCMRALDKNIASNVDIGYHGNLIISFFLKSHVEMPDLVQYFYSRNPGNTSAYASPESFMMARKELDYIFKQMYGEVGGGVNYESYACNKIAETGYCPFSNFNNKEPEGTTKDRVKELIESIDADLFLGMDDASKDAMLNIFTKLVRRNGGYKGACGLEYQLKFNRDATVRDIIGMARNREKKYIAHPVKSYLEEALKIAASNQR